MKQNNNHAKRRVGSFWIKSVEARFCKQEIKVKKSVEQHEPTSLATRMHYPNLETLQTDVGSAMATRCCD